MEVKKNYQCKKCSYKFKIFPRFKKVIEQSHQRAWRKDSTHVFGRVEMALEIPDNQKYRKIPIENWAINDYADFYSFEWGVNVIPADTSNPGQGKTHS